MQVAPSTSSPPPTSTPPQPTSLPPEGEVLALIVSGASNREIAAALYISERKVKNHITSILGTQAAMFASAYLGWLHD
ncbi:LuxR C-terminal-related transcriptional regulator [Microseira sp. BLCC-F43]|uniref:LuxR C-terminal-related transcriptional regulator n=1 Tax=Microseira sp. BLCC-F43 TaxID=3153602 RepID=UPI0035BABBD0